MLRKKLYDFFQTHKVLNLTSLTEYLTANGVVLDDEDIITGKLVINADIGEDIDLLGKTVTDLQENITVENGIVTGTLHYIDDFTDFSEDTELQEGYYLALNITSNGQIGIPDLEGRVKKIEGEDIYIIRVVKEAGFCTVLSIIDDFEIIGNFIDLSSELVYESASTPPIFPGP